MAYEATTRVTHSENIRTGKNLDVDGAANVGTLKVAGVSVGAGLGSQVTFTQTYSTVDTTVPAITSHAITDNSGGSASTSAIAAIGGTYSQSEVANAVATLAAELALAKADLLQNRKLIGKLIDVLQANGWAL